MEKQGVTPQVDLESALLRPLLKGSEISRYGKLFAPSQILFPYLVSRTNNTLTLKKLVESDLRSKYKKTLQYVTQCRKKLGSRGGAEKLPADQWFLYTYEKSLVKYGQPKLIWQVLSSRSNFSYDKDGEFVFVGGATAGGQGLLLDDRGKKKPTHDDYLELLAILNSKPIDLFVKLHSSKFKGRYFAYGKGFTKNVPVAHGSVRRSDLVQNAKSLLKLNEGLQKKQLEFDRWIVLKISLPKSFSILNISNLSENEFRMFINKHNKKISPQLMGEVVQQFNTYQRVILKILGEIESLDKGIDKIVYKIYGLDKMMSRKKITYEDFIESHPFQQAI